MFSDKRIAVVIPAYNVAHSIESVLLLLPDFVDIAIVVDDKSTDDTLARIPHRDDIDLRIVRHEENQGVGGAIATGYQRALAEKADIVAVMGADGQMAAQELSSLIEPVAVGEADYAKGNRFLAGHAFKRMPLIRYLGNLALSLLTKPVTGYWRIFDSQCGFTAIDAETLRRIEPESFYRRYGVPNDILFRLSRIDAKVVDCPVTPLYPERSSHMKLLPVCFTLSWLLTRLFIRRMAAKLHAGKVKAPKPLPQVAAIDNLSNSLRESPRKSRTTRII